MSIITSITKQKKGARVNLFIDGEFFFVLEELTCLKHSLKEGMEVDIDEIAQIQIESERQTATDKAFAYATRYFKPEKKVREYLKEKGYVKDLIDEIIAKLKDYGYVDDAKYAESYVSINAERKGINKIKADLLNAGIPKSIVKNAVKEIESQQRECEKMALRFIASHIDKTDSQLMRHLYSKGFTVDDIKRAVEKIRREEQEEMEEDEE